MFESINSIKELSNSQVKDWFMEMIHYMKLHLNDEVNVYRDKIVRYAAAIRNTPEFKMIDEIMCNLFLEYAELTCERN